MLTDEDRIRIVDAILLITFELGLRFYTDYLAGNRYFKVSASGQNLQRAMTQFHLARSVEQQVEQLKTIINDLTKTIQQ